MATLPLAPDDYLDDSECEKVNGQIRRRPVPGFEHSQLERFLVDCLTPFVGERGRVLHEWSISDGKGNWLTPDVTVTRTGYRLTSRGHLLVPPPPHLVIEIRSVDQALRDLFDKAALYRDFQVPHYWIIDLLERACYEVLTDGPERNIPVLLQSTELSADGVHLQIEQIWEFLASDF